MRPEGPCKARGHRASAFISKCYGNLGQDRLTRTSGLGRPYLSKVAKKFALADFLQVIEERQALGGDKGLLRRLQRDKLQIQPADRLGEVQILHI